MNKPERLIEQSLSDGVSFLEGIEPFDQDEQDAVDAAINSLPYRSANPDAISVAEEARAKFRAQRAAADQH